MRYGLRRLALAALTVLALVSGLSATITITPPQANVDQTVTMHFVSLAVLPDLSTFRWDFGDGTYAYHTLTVTKAYHSVGTFVVRVDFDAGASHNTETTSITITENRRITFAPALPQVQQMVSFQALNFLAASIRWDFGDGSPAQLLGPTPTHAYATPGTFAVKAYDLGGASTIPISTAVPVGVDISRRSIVALPAVPVTGQPVTFRAVNFYTTDVLWDFGDGGPQVTGGTSAAHTYASPGQYRVQAWDWAGAFGGPTSLIITVTEATGPRAAFSLSYLQLRFADGKAYKVVPRDERGLTAYADIKYEGTGVFQAQWLVDGAPFRMVTRAMPFALEMTLDSSGVMTGQPPVLPGLPTNIPGVHEVSLRIIQPAVNFLVPVLRYFVSADASVRPQDLTGARLELDSARGLQGIDCRVEAGAFRAPAGAYVILNGSLTYAPDRLPLAFALLRVHLENALVDQQFLRDLRPGEERRFTTSVFNPSGEDKWVYITLYQIDGPKAELIYFQKLRLLGAGK
jgi:hypothetical protein